MSEESLTDTINEHTVSNRLYSRSDHLNVMEKKIKWFLLGPFGVNASPAVVEELLHLCSHLVCLR